MKMIPLYVLFLYFGLWSFFHPTILGALFCAVFMLGTGIAIVVLEVRRS